MKQAKVQIYMTLSITKNKYWWNITPTILLKNIYPHSEISKGTRRIKQSIDHNPFHNAIEAQAIITEHSMDQCAITKVSERKLVLCDVKFIVTAIIQKKIAPTQSDHGI